MPRNVRNWWVECEIDGRDSTLSGGPVAKDGGFDLTIKQRNDGQIVEAINVVGFADYNGNLVLRVRNRNAAAEGGQWIVYELVTKR